MIGPSLCSAPSCEHPARTAGTEYCDAHRQRVAKYGTTELPARKTLAERFWEKVDVRGADECWPWLASVDETTGYGAIGRGVRGEGKVGAHRVAFELQNGPIPDGLTVDHNCVNRICMNGAHLEAVTHVENSRRAKRRWTHCIHGHEFTPQNTYWRKEGRRMCRECRRERRRAA